MGAVQELAGDVAKVHRDLGSASAMLRGMNEGAGQWSGDAARAFTEKTKDLPKLLATATGSFDKARRALAQWESQLSGMQGMARGYEDSAKLARQRVETAENNPDFRLAFQTFSDEAHLADAQRRLDAAAKELNEARAGLDAIIDDANRLMAQHKELAEKIARVISEAAEQAPDKPGMLDRLLDGFSSLTEGLASLASETGAWVREHADAIASAGDVLALASTAVGVVGLVLDGTGVGSVVGVPLAAVASGLSYGALLAHGTAKLAGADVDAATLAADGLGVAFGGLGSAVLKAGSASVKTVTTMERGERAVTAGIAGDTIFGLSDDTSMLDYFAPQNTRQAAEYAVPGGGLLVGFENAWKAESQQGNPVPQDDHG